MSVALPRPRRRRSKLNKEPKGVYIFLTIVGIIMFLPLYQLIITAFKPLEELFLFPPLYYVKQPTIENFEELLAAAGAGVVPFSRFLFNSVFVTFSVVSLHVLASCMAAFPLAKTKVPGGALLFNLTVAALMFSPHVTNIPRYMIVNGLGWINSYLALIVPGIGAAMGVFLMKQFLEQIPDALLEAAKIDGATDWIIFRKIIMPLSQPAWSTLIIFACSATWNDAWSPMVFTTSEAMKTLPLAISTMFSGGEVVARQGANAAAALVQTAPTIIIFLLLQKRVIETMAHAGIKS